MRRRFRLPKAEPTSQLLSKLLQSLPNKGDVSIDSLVRHMKRRSFGGVLLLLTIVALLPGISFFAGAAMIIPAVQMILGYRAPRLPRFIRERKIEVDAVRSVGDFVVPWVERAERFIKPRWTALTYQPFPMIVGVLTISLACVIVIPLPFSNLPPFLALSCLSLGLLARDGLLILLGLLMSGIALTIGVVMARLALDTFIFT